MKGAPPVGILKSLAPLDSVSQQAAKRGGGHSAHLGVFHRHLRERAVELRENRPPIILHFGKGSIFEVDTPQKLEALGGGLAP